MVDPAPTPHGAAPVPSHPMAKRAERAPVIGHSEVPDMSANDRSQPHPQLRDGPVPAGTEGGGHRPQLRHGSATSRHRPPPPRPVPGTGTLRGGDRCRRHGGREGRRVRLRGSWSATAARRVHGLHEAVQRRHLHSYFVAAQKRAARPATDHGQRAAEIQSELRAARARNSKRGERANTSSWRTPSHVVRRSRWPREVQGARPGTDLDLNRRSSLQIARCRWGCRPDRRRRRPGSRRRSAGCRP